MSKLKPESEIMKLVKGLKNSTRKKTVSEPQAVESKTATATASEPAQSASQSKATTGSSKSVVIEAKIDVGFGNSLYVRGEGEGLSWNQGIPLTCVDSSTWKWSAPANKKVKFKLLLNDSVWSQGEDIVAAPGEKIQVSPAF